MELFPFDSMRPVQKQMISDIAEAIEAKKHIIAHAPTGLGKTAASLSPALGYALENGKTILFLTPKHTQHQIVVETLKKMKEKYKININVVDFIGKIWMCLVPGVQSLTSSDFAEFCREMKKEERCVFYNKVRKSTNLTHNAEKLIKSLTKESPLNVEDVCAVCGKCEMCPYEISCELAKSANVIIADYYHIFHPSVRKSFLNKTNKDLDDCIIIVDEAQNLPERIREVLSSTISTFSVDRAVAEARKFEYLDIANNLTEIHNILIDLSEQYFDEKKESLISREDFQKRVEDATGKDFETLSAEFIAAAEKIRTENKKSFVGSIGTFMEFWTGEGDGYVRILREKHWKDKRIIQLNFRCLDPAKSSKEVFDSCHSAILMSGTLTPTRMYRDLLGMEEKRTLCREYENPFPKANKLSIIIPDTTTKYTRRNEAEFDRIAKWCGDVVNAIPGNVAVFFPSYWLRDQIMNKFERLSTKSIFLEKQGLSKKERLDMLNEFKSFSGTGAVFMGAAAGSFSIDYSEPILIKEKNSIKIVKIGEFIDELMKDKNEIKKLGYKDGEYKLIKSPLRAACFDSEYKIRFKPIDKVIRHRINEKLFELVLDTQRAVKVTESHNLFCLESGDIVTKKTSELKIGDYVVIPKVLPSDSKFGSKLDLLSELTKLPNKLISKLSISNIASDYLTSKQKMKDIGCLHDKYKCSIKLPWLKCKELWKKNIFDNHHITIGTYGGIKIPRYLNINKDFMRLLGYYVSEGHCRWGRHSDVTLTFGTHEKDVIKDAKRCISSVFNMHPKEKLSSDNKSATQLVFGGKIASVLFNNVLKIGTGAENKRVPKLVFDAPYELKIEFLKGYFTGDGTACKKHELSCKTTSKYLASDLMYLLLQLGIIASLTKIKRKIITKEDGAHTYKTCYHVFISNIDQLEKMLDIVPNKYILGVKEHIMIGRKNKKRRTLLPYVIPIKESGLLELYNSANPHKPRNSRDIASRIKQETIRKDLCLELLDYIVKNARFAYNKKLEQNIRRLIDGDLAFARIKSIRKCKPTSNNVYDVSIKKYENFVGGRGGIILHNSEGIDLPGKFLNGVVVVGVPLETPDLETQSLIDYYEKLFGAGWDYGYIFPAMNKVVQACGRTIRSESDRGVIVLIDERFTWKNYFKCLPLDWKVIVTKEPVRRIADFFKQA